MERRPKIEIVRVPSNEHANFRSLDGVGTGYNHIRVGTCCPEPEVKMVVCDGKPPIEQTRKLKRNLGPVSKLLRRRHHATYLATKSCDNIYSVNRSSGSLDWRVSQTPNEQVLQSRQSGSLDWRVGRSINKLHWRDATRSAEQLSRSGDHLQTPSTKSKLFSLLRRLSPRLSRPGSKSSLQSSPTICPWVQVEYSTESINDGLREDSQESDASFQRELQMNELRKRMAGIPTNSQVTTKNIKDAIERQSCSKPRIQVQQPANECDNAVKSLVDLVGLYVKRWARCYQWAADSKWFGSSSSHPWHSIAAHCRIDRLVCRPSRYRFYCTLSETVHRRFVRVLSIEYLSSYAI